MRITPQQYDKAKEKIQKLAKSQEIVTRYEGALKSRPLKEGEVLIAMKFKDGRFTYETDKEEDRPLLKK